MQYYVLRLLLYSNVFFVPCRAQDTLVLQPNADCGKDAMIWQLSNQNGQFGPTETTNYGNSKQFIGHEWTWNGDPGTRMSLINFNVNNYIPQGSTILSAKLDLFAFPNSPDGGHSSATGSNEAILQRITEPWNEQTVVWINQPAVTSANAVTLAQSTADDEDYLNIDVTALYQDMVNNPATGHGLRLSIQVNAYYRAMIFASSDHPDPQKHPRLTLIFDAPTPVDTSGFDPNCVNNFTSPDTIPPNAPDIPQAQLEVPNIFTPNGDQLNDLFTPVSIHAVNTMYTRIVNRWGQVIYETSDIDINWNGTNSENQEVSEGVYFWRIEVTDLNGSQHIIHGYVQLER